MWTKNGKLRLGTEVMTVTSAALAPKASTPAIAAPASAVVSCLRMVCLP